MKTIVSGDSDKKLVNVSIHSLEYESLPSGFPKEYASSIIKIPPLHSSNTFCVLIAVCPK